MSHQHLPGAIVATLLLAGCPYLGQTGYTDKVRDYDGDGLVAERFGGPDCDDGDPDIGDCDADDDGVRSVAAGGTDCDDQDASVYPGAPEQCDGIDHDCDGLIGNDDDDVTADAPLVYPDDDGDGWGRDVGAIPWCGAAPEGYVTEVALGDCDDANAGIHPGAEERCTAIDEDCDGDPQLGAIDAIAWWSDTDGDGYGDGDTIAVQCAPPADTVARDEQLRDCAPTDSSIHPEAPEIPYDGVDQDCDGADLVDVDGDGFDGGPLGVDCDDTTDAVSPAQVETCNGTDDDCDGVVDDGVLLTWYPDFDTDGHGDPTGQVVLACAAPSQHVLSATDCDDTTADRAPDAPEVCDGLDNDCDGVVDSGALDLVVRYPDEDGDLFGDEDGAWEGCLADLPLGIDWVDQGLDCDDANERVHPGSLEVCDLLDNDCNGAVDDQATDAILAYADNDHDRFGDPSQPVMLCNVEEGFSTIPTDCDDADPESFPGAPETCFDGKRQDCSGAPVDDCDADGTPDILDCEPDDPAFSLSATEVCDGVDNDCDDLVDSNDPSVDPASAQQYYLDEDQDGYSSGVEVGAVQCEPPALGIPLSEYIDCDDRDALRTPFADELCDTIDNDCDGVVDENPVDPFPWYIDLDGDDHGDASAEPALYQCDDPGDGYVRSNDDCSDAVAAVYPGATEACDSLDNDCDGLVDDDDPDAATVPWFFDGDNDGAGDGAPVFACIPPADHVGVDGDCDDADGDRFPAAIETCDGIDNDCDGQTDFNDSDLDGVQIWFDDLDGDGFGDPNTPTNSCVQPPNTSRLAGDCDDADISVYPGAIEVCDGIDNDCVDGIDAGDLLVAPLWFADRDGDGWGDPGLPTRACDQPDQHVVLAGDCNDDPTDEPSDPAADVYPGAEEDCSDGIDNDCDGLVDAADLDAAEQVWYYDADGDGFGDPLTATEPQCAPPVGPPGPGDWVRVGGDCDDLLASVGPGQPEICDGIDNNCDGDTDDDDTDDLEAPIRFVDDDGDGYGRTPILACSTGDGIVDEPGDCNDDDAGVNPGAPEVCTDSGAPVDENCDGLVDVDLAPVFLDSDDDGYGDAAVPRPSCATGQALTWVANDEDCDDANPSVSPAATEVCNGILPVDDDCDGLVDTVDPDLDTDTLTTWVPDLDRDGVYDLDTTIDACVPPTASWNDASLADVSSADDCNDEDPGVRPGAAELCDGLDNDCNGAEDDVGPDDGPPWYVDVDLDGYAADDATPQYTCGTAGLTQQLGDCDDGNNAVAPDLPEVCDLYDNNCDGLVNADDPTLSDGLLGWVDDDSDGVGDSTRQRLVCADTPGVAFADGDCDDSDPNNFPGNPEVCDSNDNDCSGHPDDNIATNFFVPDLDGDGVYDQSAAIAACDDPDGLGLGWEDASVAVDDDCNDQDPTVHPFADEICDGIRNDCTANPADDNPVDGVPYYPDLDGDLFGDAYAGAVFACEPPAGHVLDNTDCFDGDLNVRPGLPIEVCGNSLDDNCDGFVDEEGTEAILLDGIEYYEVQGAFGTNIDVDEDGWIDDQYNRADLVQLRSCDADVVDWADARSFGDCDDDESAVHPQAVEICDGEDNDCDGAVDADDGNIDFEGNSVDVHLDLDRDGARSTMIVDQVCPGAWVDPGYVLFDPYVDPDCDDTDIERSPLLVEVCDGVDNDCDETNDFLEVDEDDDGYFLCDPDECDDTAKELHPNTLWFYPDEDGDGFVGAPTDLQVGCTQPAPLTYAWGNQLGDCGEGDADTYPGAPEQCDGVDNNCDGELDGTEGDVDGDGVAACLDCDDNDADVYPGAPELCDGRINDCDLAAVPTDETDDDFDGYVECSPWLGPYGAILGGDDCDDGATILYPGQTVLADGYGFGDFLTIQSAIDAVCDGATIDVQFEESPASSFVLPTDKVVTIRGISSLPTQTGNILADGTPPGTRLERLEPDTSVGYGLLALNGAQVIADDLVFFGGRGLQAQSPGTEVICTDCIFDQNNAVFGSSVFASNSAKLVLNRATVSDATSSNDAAVYANNGAELEIYDSEFTTNELTNAGEAATGLAVRSADLILERTSFTGHISGDRQPTILLSGFATSHQLTDVKLVDNDGGVWITGSAQVDLTGLVAYRNGGKITAEREGAVEVRNGGNIVTLYNAELAANDGPGLNISPTDPTSTVDVGWSTFVGNGEAGIAYTAAGGLTVNYSVFNFHTSDIAGPNLMSLTGPQENWYEHATSVFDHCATVYPAVCYSGDPQFLTFHPNLQSDRWVLRPEGQAGPLWNGAGNIFGAGDPFSIIGHSGGPLGDAMQWYADDGDGVRDGWELFWHGTTDNDGEDDVDGDGVDELTEYNRGTSPIHQDTDEDTYPDDCEELFGTNPQNPLSFPLSQCP